MDQGHELSFSADGLTSIKSQRFKTGSVPSLIPGERSLKDLEAPRPLEVHFRSMRRMGSALGSNKGIKHTRSLRGILEKEPLHAAVTIELGDGTPVETQDLKKEPGCLDQTVAWAEAYTSKMKGVGDAPIGVPPYQEMALTFFGVFCTLLLLCALTKFVSPHMADCGWVITSFGATAVLVYCVPESKLCQPRNFMGGQIIGAVVGVSIRLALDGTTDNLIWISGPLATSLAILLMQLTKTTHPPGGGTALALGLLPSLSATRGWLWVVTVTLGSIVFLICGILINNHLPRDASQLFGSTPSFSFDLIQNCYNPSICIDMLRFHILTVLLLASLALICHSSCPCESPELCLPVSIQHDTEVFGFIEPSVPSSEYHFSDYDFLQLTTIAWADNITLVCKAHRFGTRVVIRADVDDKVLHRVADAHKRKEWISKLLAKSKSNFLDGVNFDLEVALLPSDELTSIYTLLVNETVEAFHTEIPGSQISVDIPWSPFDVDGRNYDWQGLSAAADLLFVMAYDTQSQVWGRCIASANSPSSVVRRSLHQWIEVLGLPRDKLILGLPWYGYRYPCVADDLPKRDSDICVLSPAPFQGAPCSDAAGSQLTYRSILSILRSKNAAIKWDSLTESPYFNYQEGTSGQRYQIWFDDPSSLAIKYQIAADYSLRGVGIWHIEALDYSDASAWEMWQALKVFTRPLEPLRYQVHHVADKS